MGQLEQLVLKDLWVSLVLRVLKGLMDSRVHPVLKETLVLQVLKVILVCRGRRVLKVLQGLLVPPDHLVLREQEVFQDNPVGPVLLGHLVLQDR